MNTQWQDDGDSRKPLGAISAVRLAPAVFVFIMTVLSEIVMQDPIVVNMIRTVVFMYIFCDTKRISDSNINIAITLIISLLIGLTLHSVWVMVSFIGIDISDFVSEVIRRIPIGIHHGLVVLSILIYLFSDPENGHEDDGDME